MSLLQSLGFLSGFCVHGPAVSSQGLCVCAYATHYLLIGCNFKRLSQRAGIVKNSDADVCTVSLAYIFRSSVLLAPVFPKDSFSAHQVRTWHNSVKEDWLN